MPYHLRIALRIPGSLFGEAIEPLPEDSDHVPVPLEDVVLFQIAHRHPFEALEHPVDRRAVYRLNKVI